MIKNFIKKNLNKDQFDKIILLYFFFKTLHLRVKYFYLKNILFIPSRHLLAINIYSKLLFILKKKNIKIFLLEGLLLGAIRQGAFAGRPKDLDFGILENDYQKFLSLKKEFEKNFNLNVADPDDKKKRKLIINHKNIWLRIDTILIDIFILKEITKNKKKYWGFIHPEFKDKYFFDYNDLINLKKIKIYGNFQVYIPQKSHMYLKKFFGKNWKKFKKNSKNFVYTNN